MNRRVDNAPWWAEWQDEFNALLQPTVWVELAALASCLALAWGLVSLLRKAFGREDGRSIFLGRSVFDGALFPILSLSFAYLARLLVQPLVPLAAFKVVIPLLVSLVAIRVGAKVLQAAFPQSDWVRPIERTISWLAWLASVFWVTGLLPYLLDELDQITWKLGGSTVSVRTLLEGALTAGTLLLLSLWVSSALEARLLRAATGGELSMRKAVSNALRALLMFLAVITALSSVGIDLTALSVLGGAVGVGIGFGLQKLAANYVSGFVILAERSMRIGDSVRVDNFEGRITNINARYTVIRSPGGRESIVPNEMLITQRVENLSLADPRVWRSTVVSVAYDSDVDLVMRLLLDAVTHNPRVLPDPAPSVALSAFGADGLEFTVGYWVGDPEIGVMGLRSEINLVILRSLREHGIEIPYPQRVMHWQQAPEKLAPLPAKEGARI